MNHEAPPEQALLGWEEIASFFRWSVSKAISKKEELQECGAIFYSYLGTPPGKCVQAFPSNLRAWQIRKSVKREIL